MQFHDETGVETAAPLPLGLHRLLGAVVAGAALMESAGPQINELHVTVVDCDHGKGILIPHLQLNFEPRFLDARVRFWLGNLFAETVHSELLEDSDKRFAWGVWVE